MHKQSPLDYFFVLLSLVLYIIIGYYIERHETNSLFLVYFSLFALYIFLIRKRVTLTEGEPSFWIIASVLFRFALLFSTPALSDDFYRFIWDGRVLAAGHSPFAEVPSFYMNPENALPGLDMDLFSKLNSKERFSSYPPVCQLIFWASAKISPNSLFGSVFVMKVILFLFEISTFWMIKKLLDRLKIERKTLLVYALNPLAILEITGNLHFEGVMTFFLLAALYLLMRGRHYASSGAMAISVCTKLVPLLFLPLLLRLLGWKKAFVYWALTGAATILLFVPLLSRDIIHGFSTSLGYYFQRFEFNASIYYLFRGVGYLIFGFNIIQFAGPLLAIVAAILIFRISFKQAGSPLGGDIYPVLFKNMLWCVLIYFLSTTILHPWYIITLLAISLFTPYHFPILWTGLIFLTYAGYTEDSFYENLLLVALEYIALFTFIIYESLWTSRRSHS